MRTCPATLLLSRGRYWEPCPKFAAAVDVSERETSELGARILRTSKLLSFGFPGELDVLYSEPEDVDQREHKEHLARLEALTLDAAPRGTTVQVLAGNPEEALPTFAASRAYDAFIMGALTQRKGSAKLVGTLTARLVESLECDFVLVKPSTYRSEIELTGERECVIPFVPAVAVHYTHSAPGS